MWDEANCAEDSLLSVRHILKLSMTRKFWIDFVFAVTNSSVKVNPEGNPSEFSILLGTSGHIGVMVVSHSPS